VIDPPRPQPGSESLAEIVARLRSAQKSNRGAPGYSRWVNRKLGRYLAALAFQRGMTPNQVTAASATATFAGIIAVATVRPDVWLGVLVGLLLMLGFALDAADGQLARLRGGGSSAGEWLDHVVDCAKSSAIHLSVLVCWYRFFDLPSEYLLLIPLVFAWESAVFFFSIILSEQLRKIAAPAARPATVPSAEPAPVLRSIIVLPADYGVLCISFLLLGVQPVFIWLYALLMVANLVFLFGAWPRWYAEMKGLSAHRAAT
jgi:phosphatidylglycerophosphate synthase